MPECFCVCFPEIFFGNRCLGIGIHKMHAGAIVQHRTHAPPFLFKNVLKNMIYLSFWSCFASHTFSFGLSLWSCTFPSSSDVGTKRKFFQKAYTRNADSLEPRHDMQALFHCGQWRRKREGCSAVVHVTYCLSPFFTASSWWVSVSPHGCVHAFPAENKNVQNGRKSKQLFIKDQHF